MRLTTSLARPSSSIDSSGITSSNTRIYSTWTAQAGLPHSTPWNSRTFHVHHLIFNKKAVLSQRWPRNVPYTVHGCPENFRDSQTMPTATISNICHRHLFRSTLWMFLKNLKSVALPVPEIKGVAYPKNLGSSWIRPWSLFSKILMGFYSDWPCKCTCWIWSP